MVRESGQSPEQIDFQSESESVLAKRKLAERIKTIPDKFQLLDAQVREAVLKYLEDKGMSQEKQFWSLYDENRTTLRHELFSKSNDVITLKQHHGETISVPNGALRRMLL